MTKTELKEYLGGTVPKMAERLGYKDRQSINRLPEELTPRMFDDITRRMRGAKPPIKVPKEWKA